MKKRLLLFLSMFFLISGIYAQVIEKTINMTKPGTLTDSLTNAEKQNITNLTLTGPIDARDFRCMRDKIMKLAVLNLKAALIQEYIGAEGTAPEQITYKAKQIPDFAFCDESLTGKTTLAKVTFPDNLTETGFLSFYSCTGLTGPLELPSTLEVIGEFSFCICSGFTGELTIPESVTSIEKGAFSNCTGFTGKLTIPSGIKVINPMTFFRCSGLSSVEISKGVTLVDSLAFRFCTGLQRFNSCPVIPPMLGYKVFDHVDKSKCVLHVPIGTLKDYLNVSQWASFVHIVDDLPLNIDEDTAKDVEILHKNNHILVNSEHELAYIEIYDTLGRTIINKKTKGNSYLFTISRSGYYIVRMYMIDGSVKTKKININ